MSKIRSYILSTTNKNKFRWILEAILEPCDAPVDAKRLS